MPIVGYGNYIANGLSSNKAMWKQIANNQVPLFDYSAGIGAGFTLITFPINSINMIACSFELDGDPATQALSSTVKWQNGAGSPVALTSVFTLANSGVDTVSKLVGSLPYVYDATQDNTGLTLLLTLGTGHTLAAAELTIMSYAPA